MMDDKMSITCIDCNKRKEPASAIGSWQCENCQTRLFNRVRSQAGRHKNKYFAQIENLMNKGLTGPAIVNETGFSASTVHRYMKRIEGMEVAQ